MKAETPFASSRLVPVLLCILFFLLYLSTCQRGWCWQDGGLFQRRIFSGDVVGSFGIAAAHPVFIMLGMAVDSVCRMLGGGLGARLFLTNAQSALWMALAVGVFAAAVRRYSGSAKSSWICGFAFGFSHMAWWMGTICEVHALEIFLFAAELFVLAGEWTEKNSFSRSAILFAMCGVHFSVHNLALLALPVYAYLAWRNVKGPNRAGRLAVIALCWVLGSSPVLILALRELARSGFVATVRSVLVGSFGGEVLGVVPSSPKLFFLNAALAAMSFAMPAACLWASQWNTRERGKPLERTPAEAQLRVPLFIILAIHALFLARYFVPDQAFFLLPTFVLSLLIVSPGLADERRLTLALVSIAILGVWGPLLAVRIASSAPRLDRGTHPGRDDVMYFAIPWKFDEDSCDRLVKERGLEDVWAGYLPGGGK